MRQRPARSWPLIENGAAVAPLDQLFGHGEARRTRTHDSHAPTRWFRQVGGQRKPTEMLPLPVRHKRFKLADADRRLLAAIWPNSEADRTFALAEALLRAEPAAHLRQIGGLAETSGGCQIVAAFKQQQRAWNVVMGGTNFYAGRGWAMDAASGFQPCAIEVEALVHLFPVVDALFW